MKHLGLPKGLLDSVNNMLRGGSQPETNLQEKIRQDNSTAKRANSFADAYNSVVADDRKASATQQREFAENAAKAHMRMGKSIVEEQSIVQREQSFVSDEVIEQMLAIPATLYASKRMYVSLDEQSKAIADFARSFMLSFDKMVSEHVDESIRSDESFASAIVEIKNNIRNMLLNSNNIGTAVAKVNEASKVRQFVDTVLAEKCSKAMKKEFKQKEEALLKARTSKARDAVDEASDLVQEEVVDESVGTPQERAEQASKAAWKYSSTSNPDPQRAAEMHVKAARLHNVLRTTATTASKKQKHDTEIKRHRRAAEQHLIGEHVELTEGDRSDVRRKIQNIVGRIDKGLGKLAKERDMPRLKKTEYSSTKSKIGKGVRSMPPEQITHLKANLGKKTFAQNANEDVELTEGSHVYCPDCGEDYGKASEYGHSQLQYCANCGYEAPSKTKENAKKAANSPSQKRKTNEAESSIDDVCEAKKLVGTYTHTNGHTAKVYKLSGEHNEGDPYHVKLFKGGKHYEPADYFTNDEDDAHGTAKHMVKESADAVELSESVNLIESIAVHGKYTIKTGAFVSGMGEGPPDRVKAHGTKLKSIGVKADAAAKDGRYGTTHRVVVKNNETGETTHHHVYQSDKVGNKPIMSVRTVGAPRANQDEHHKVLKDYLSGKKPTTQPVKESAVASILTPKGAKQLAASVASRAKGGIIPFQSTIVTKDGTEVHHGYTDSKGNRHVTKVVKEGADLDKKFDSWKSQVLEKNPKHAANIKFKSKTDQRNVVSAEHGDRSFGTFNTKTGEGVHLGEEQVLLSAEEIANIEELARAFDEGADIRSVKHNINIAMANNRKAKGKYSTGWGKEYDNIKSRITQKGLDKQRAKDEKRRAEAYTDE